MNQDFVKGHGRLARAPQGGRWGGLRGPETPQVRGWGDETEGGQFEKILGGGRREKELYYQKKRSPRVAGRIEATSRKGGRSARLEKKRAHESVDYKGLILDITRLGGIDPYVDRGTEGKTLRRDRPGGE